jgi:acyl-[acyl-carrier-protein]-phospholipid O-acyltransferase/long-chain-fatty-acid--[acyl-carrier-protein] ligase
MWLGMVLGMKVAGQADPMDGKALGKLAEQAGATFLLSTPTFVRGYLRRIEAQQFSKIRFAVVGAERCDAELKRLFKERYNADLLEGYGCTDLCPVVAINLPEVKRDGEHEVRARDGSVGRALPGIHVFTVHPETHEVLPTGAEGLLVVRSAARMRGYLGQDDLTNKAFIHGGYNTGDIGKIDGDGFIFITGRLARFAKIGGEMVPLDNVETALQALVGEEIEVAVSAVADPAKGERLIVLSTGAIDTLSTGIPDLANVPALWRPKATDLIQVEAIPKLGTGKRDLAGIKRMAAEAVEARSKK